MNTLIEWPGKAEDITISYYADLSPERLLPGTVIDPGESSKQIIIPNERSGEYREVTETVFENSVKKADRIDYLIALACGSFAGLIDVFYVGEFSLERAREWGSKKVDAFVMKIAHMVGYKGDDLSDAIRFLEKMFPIAADKNTPDFGGGRQHHLRDFSHHFSIGGLLCSLFTQFSGMVIGTDTEGRLQITPVKDDILIGKDFPQKLVFGIIQWFFHMVSDMAGSSFTTGKGTGIPGPIVALIKKLSALPCFREKKIGETELHTWVSKLFNGTLLAKRDKNGKITEAMPFDLRTEIGILHEVGRQSIPVLINECLVRGIYFVRRLYLAIKDAEIHSISDLKKIDSSDLLPFNNRIIRRMITVSSGVFIAIDTSDAAVRAVIKNGGINKGFAKDFIVRINIVGIGRFAVACVADARLITEDIMTAKEQRDRTEKEYEKVISDFDCLSLDYEQTQILLSIEQLIVSDDIQTTKDDEIKKRKSQWNEEWKQQWKSELRLTEDGYNEYFLSEQDIAEYLDSRENDSWKQLIAMEAALFKPYYPLSETQEKKELSKLKSKSKYLTERFVTIQNSIHKEDIKALMGAFKKSSMTITGTTQKLVIGAVGTTVLVAVSGGLAYFFAPAIATAIVGESAGGLYGAALTSYSLAAIGGGSLAAGGLGMAGGTAIITGGGAILAALSGTGASAISTLTAISNDNLVLFECCKLLSFSKEILIKRYNDYYAVAYIQAVLEERINVLKKQIKLFDDSSDTDKKKNDKETKTKKNAVQKSLKYLERCNKSLRKLIQTKSKKSAV